METQGLDAVSGNECYKNTLGEKWFWRLLIGVLPAGRRGRINVAEQIK